MTKDFNGIAKDIKSIDEKLGNHIGDTNKKIESLDNNLSKRIDTLSDRFDRLYEILLQEKTKK